MNLFSHPHRRYNILTGEWVLVSPHRTKRPWKGKTDTPDAELRPAYDPGCYLCPGNKRANGDSNPRYESTYVFTNDYSALYEETSVDSVNTLGLIVAESEKGISKVICYSPRHDLYVTRMNVSEIEGIVNVWKSEYMSIGDKKNIDYVQIFENKGARMGASNPHPHCQVWASESVPVIPALETEKQRVYKAETGSCLLCEYIKLETGNSDRIVIENDEFVALVPFWAVWPFETMILPKTHMSSMLGLDPRHVSALAEIIKSLAIRYDNLFTTEFPYSMGIHQKPTDGQEHGEWHFHFHYYPPLLRSATVSKFMVGYELLAMPQRDITAESAAESLRNLSAVHYMERTGTTK
jgi:UDPglucose--hexose-1-phosphate uridylyltransferase